MIREFLKMILEEARKGLKAQDDLNALVHLDNIEALVISAQRHIGGDDVTEGMVMV